MGNDIKEYLYIYLLSLFKRLFRIQKKGVVMPKIESCGDTIGKVGGKKGK